MRVEKNPSNVAIGVRSPSTIRVEEKMITMDAGNYSEQDVCLDFWFLFIFASSVMSSSLDDGCERVMRC